MKFNMTREALARADRVVPNIETCTRAARKELDAAEARAADFWMVYREGGHSPTFKHTAEEKAITEAKRIARESGEATYVLSAIRKVEPHALPTPAEFARHASAHPFGIAGRWGLWRVCVEERLPAVIAVRCGDGGP